VPIIEGLWLKIGPIINLDLGATQRLGTGVAERHHARWVAAIASRNSAEARAALADDIRTSAEFIISNGSLPP
jgi:DNA-binding GntR family transcriptional regulator